ncbi:MAG: FHA domain-containing protein [Microbacteriaceae bacterium]
MSDNPFLITPPPGLLPTPSEPEPTAAAVESTTMIELPAQFNTGTRKMAPSRGVEATVAPVVLAPTFAIGPPEPTIEVEAVLEAGVEAAAAPNAPAAPAAPQWRLLLQGGVPAIALEGAVVVGRKPKPLDEYPNATLVAVSDTTRTVSSSHVLFGIDSTGLWLADLDSTNGTAVTTPAGVRATVDPSAPVYLESGSVLEFGEFKATLDFS